MSNTFAIGDMVEVPFRPCPCCPPLDGTRDGEITREASEEDVDAALSCGYDMGDPPYYWVAESPAHLTESDAVKYADVVVTVKGANGRERYYWNEGIVGASWIKLRMLEDNVPMAFRK